MANLVLRISRIAVRLTWPTLFMLVVMVIKPSKLCETHRHKFGKEHGEYRHECDTLDPGVCDDRAGQAWIRECFVGGCEQLSQALGAVIAKDCQNLHV